MRRGLLGAIVSDDAEIPVKDTARTYKGDHAAEVYEEFTRLACGRKVWAESWSDENVQACDWYIATYGVEIGAEKFRSDMIAKVGKRGLAELRAAGSNYEKGLHRHG